MRNAIWFFAHLILFSLMACSAGPAAVEIRLSSPDAPDPFEGIQRWRVRVEGPDMEPLSAERAARAGTSVELPPVSFGVGRRVWVEGLDADGALLSAGSSAPFILDRERPGIVEVFFHRVDRFSSSAAVLADGRYEHSATLLPDGRVAIVGGRTRDGAVSATVEFYDPATDSISRGPDLARARAGHRAAWVGERLVIVAGVGGSGSPLSSVELYDPAEGSVGTLSLREARKEHAVAAISAERLMVIGGAGADGAPLERTELVDVGTRQIVDGPENGPRRAQLVAFVLAGGHVLAAGGIASDGATSSSVFDYGIGNESWARVTSMPLARAAAEGAVAGGVPYLVGGSGDEVESVIDVAAASVAGSLANARRDHAVAVVGEALLVAGGQDAAARAVELVEGGQVRPAGEMLFPRRGLTLTALADGAVVAIGGINAADEPVVAVERFYGR